MLERSSRRRKSLRPRAGCVHVEHLECRTLLTSLVWSTGPALPAARTDAVAVVAPNNSVYLLGGDSTLATSVPTLAANATDWGTGQDIDTQRYDLGAVRAGNAIYIFGGTGNTEGSDESLFYDSHFGDSQNLAKMNTARYDFGFAVDSSRRAYAIGGIGVFDDGEIWSQAERYDPASGVWSSIASMPQARHGLSAIGDSNGHIFVFGGSTTLDSSGIQATSLVYDIATDSWSNRAPMPIPTRDSAVVIDHTGAIFVLGGRTTTGATDAVQVYDATTNSWSTQTPLAEPVYGHAAAYDSLGRIIVAGGFDSTDSPTTAVHRTQQLNIAETAPVFSTSPVTAASLDRAYTYDVNATGNPAPTYSLITAPAGMAINATSGVISWQPVDGQVGAHSVTVQASNVVGQLDQTFDITVVADTIAPTVPTDFVVASVTETTITLAWTASSDAVGVDRYEVFTAVYSGPRFGKRWHYTLVDTVTTTTSTITGFAPFSGAQFSVQAVDAAGNRSARSPRIVGTTVSAPTLTTQSTGTVTGPALHPINIQLASRANPAATFSLVTGPAGMVVDSATGAVQWTPAVADVGIHTVTFRATNSVGSTDLDVSIEVVSDAPQLSVRYNPATDGTRYAVAGTQFTAQVDDASSTPPTYELIAAPTGMAIDSSTGAITWTPAGRQGGTHTVTVRGTSTGGVNDFTFTVLTHFAAAVTGVTVTGTTLLHPTVSWIAPTGEGADLVDSYQINAYVRYRNGRAWRTHTVNYTATAAESSVELTGLLTGKNYRLTITPVDAAGNLALPNRDGTVLSLPALPVVRWTVNGFAGGLSVPGPVIAGQPAELVLTPQGTDPVTLTLVSGPAELTFDPITNTGSWTPGAADVTSGYSTVNVTFEATNSVGSVNVLVPIRVYFSGAVRNLSAVRYGNIATAQWSAPTDNATPIAGYQLTRRWTAHGRPRSSTWTVGPDVTTTSFGLYPTGAVSHRGVSVTPIDANGNMGVSTSLVTFNRPVNNLPPIATADNYNATEDTLLSVNVTNGLRANDIDTDNTPFINPLQARVVSHPANGSLALSTTGAFTYVPNPEFTGTDTFTYLVNDRAFNSNTATVTINVASVNDAPAALDDHYAVNQDSVLTVSAAAGVLANDSDADGDTLKLTLIETTTHGTVTLNADGSFVYAPDAGYSGNDSFTYVASDTLSDSRTATVSIFLSALDPPTGGTRFFVSDQSARGTFEYDTDGGLVESYGLAAKNRKPVGVAANADGAIVWAIDKQKRVFIYDNAGNELGMWKVEDLKKPEGIATDGANIWIVDRRLDRVLYFAGAATQRNGTLVPTSSFALDRANRNPLGITTDGQSIWVVNNYLSADKVFKYDTSGNLLGSWTIDSANQQPTGLTIDPNNVDHVWIVDNAADRVFQYSAAASRLAGTQNADVSFALDAANINPQGIADPASPVSAVRATAVEASIEPTLNAQRQTNAVSSNTEQNNLTDRVTLLSQHSISAGSPLLQPIVEFQPVAETDPERREVSIAQHTQPSGDFGDSGQSISVEIDTVFADVLISSILP